jgi:asparagine synthase (glutamine-hydrolysing)
MYEERGKRVVDELRGMFAFALWDENDRSVLLGRDRLGEKPLYLWRERQGDAKRVWFSSEFRSILMVRSRNLVELNHDAVCEFLTYQYLIEPRTLVEGVTQLAPGHTLRLSPDNLDGVPERYWSLEDVEARAEPRPVEAVRSWFETACLRMGVADVPVGVSLSGGIDSSLVAAVSAKHYPGQIHGFTVGYDTPVPTDERAIAKRFAKELNISLTEVEITAEEVTRSFPALVHSMDTPVGDIAAYGYYAVARAARRAGVPVLLSGLGGDEVFWGYDWVRNAVAVQDSGFPPPRRPWRPWRRPQLEDRFVKDRSIFARHPEIVQAAALAHKLVSGGKNAEPESWFAEARTDPDAPADLAVWATLNRTWLLGNSLTLFDRVSMAHSVEGRIPFLDVDLVDGMAGLRRSGLRDDKMQHKFMILAAFGHLLPSEIKDRKKQGFTPPVHLWIGEIVNRYKFLLTDEGALERQGAVDMGIFRADGNCIDMMTLFKLILLEIWVRVTLEMQAPEEIAANALQRAGMASAC